jgi:hypothetical protein
MKARTMCVADLFSETRFQRLFYTRFSDEFFVLAAGLLPAASAANASGQRPGHREPAHD